ncbi:T9SS type A sorting domain-containing protein [Hymenobacter sp.]|uniref:Ig-like domain-containing protein n=1 Tax=Hymenobacter sp. TaxID=1898978 RepID=UPI002EDA3AB1
MRVLVLASLLSAVPLGSLRAQSTIINGPAGSGLFGSSITVLPNGNFVVTDPGFDNGTTLNVGAVYLYNGNTNALISTLVGTKTNDQVGSGGAVALANGNYVVCSPSWNNVSAANAGAVTWASGTTGITGAVSAANSLVGTLNFDQVGGFADEAITVLTNGNYVVRSTSWNNGAITDAGAVTWGNGTAGVSGPVSVANSLVGTTANDNVGSNVTSLPNGNYVVGSSNWDNGAVANVGAVTWGDGATGITGVVSAANSLVGTTAGDQVGSSAGVTAFVDSNYLVRSFFWDNGPLTDAGAVTLGIGTGGTTGFITGCNSVVGSTSFQSNSFDAYNTTTAALMVGVPTENKVVIGVGAPPAPVGAATQTVPAAATVASLQATGTAVQWYAAASGGTPLPTTTPLVDGSTYYASQTVGGCESLTRLAVTVNAPPLPVELTAFTATAQGDAAVRLAWATASEKNSATFEVERSADGTAFARIGAVAAAGYSSASRTYELLDARLPTGAVLLYYRLRQVDQDGTASYSPVRTVALTGKSGLALYPNPTRLRVATLAGAVHGTTVTVFDALGRPVATAPANAAGTAALVLPQGATAGVYVVRAGTTALRLAVE